MSGGDSPPALDLSTIEGITVYLNSNNSSFRSGHVRGVLTNVDRVTGGLANHTYRARFEGPDGPYSLIVKYSPPNVAFDINFALTNKRGFFEYSSLAHVPKLPTSVPNLVDHSKAVHYDTEAHVLVLADVGKSAQTLKKRLIDDATTIDVRSIGRGLGEWLAELHLWGETDAAAPLREVLSKNIEVADVALRYTFGGLVPDDDPLWKEVRQHVESIRAAIPTSPFIVHGDFWTGNVLLSDGDEPGTPKLTVLDWEACNCRAIPWNDIGQMCSEMYQPTFFGHAGEEGPQLIAAFLEGYKSRKAISKEDARMAVVRFGVHLFVWPGMSGWGNDESVGRCKELGREYIQRAWSRDWEWIKSSTLGELLDD
ncbi:hypothetical protein FA15DRAFT_692168 [Coprinopsis marcescibilis]|uniref:Aminoglycoside phosphotransferase domain-containing protein n=1 Tax=Coprinopsis marcescibilis TaxID=230819 RepID=A0A5C3L4B8_COPMA|nr:hypothetical protein FA15DRAFT_692168 [Coprinopsis marcescibilis]